MRSPSLGGSKYTIPILGCPGKGAVETPTCLARDVAFVDMLP